MTNKKGFRSNLILAVVTVTLLFLLAIQMSWLSRIAEFDQSQFEIQVSKLLMGEIPFTVFRTTELTGFNMDENLEITFNKELYRTPDTRLSLEIPDESSLIRKQELLEQLLDSVLKAHGIEDEFVFGTRMMDQDSFDLISNDSYTSQLLNSGLEGCINCIEVVKRPVSDASAAAGVKSQPGDVLINTAIRDGSGRINRPPDKIEMLHLHFPKRDFAFLKNVPFQMGAAVTSIVILFGAFFYLFRLFSKQKRLSEMKKDFVNNLTHELKTPIASILLSTKVLGKSKTVSMTIQDKSFLTLIQNEGKRLENQVDKVLQIAMIDSDNFTINQSDTNLHTILGSVLESLQMIIQQRKADISLNLEATVPVISGDETHLFNLFYNLVENALKYSDGKPRVYLSTESRNGHIMITVRDEGIGIDKENREHIFDRFYRGQRKDIYKEKGFGLGLSYVKSIVDAHSGTIEVKSEPGAGSSFIVTLNTTDHEQDTFDRG